MLTSIALILISGLFSRWLFSKLQLPSLIGMILTGILISPYCLNLLDSSILEISKDIRQVALIIILTRAGLSLHLDDLKKVGRPAVFLCFVPACFEILGTLIFAPMIFQVTFVEAALIGTVLAAVSPAVIVPRMIRFMEEKKGIEKSIPQMILAGASIDDIFVLVLFSSCATLLSQGSLVVIDLIQIPSSILLGAMLGCLAGHCLIVLFRRSQMNSLSKVLVLLCVSFLILELEALLEGILAISGLVSIMTCGMWLKYKTPDTAKALSSTYNQMWYVAEIFLFVLVGAAMDLQYALNAGPSVLLLVVLALCFRVMGVLISVAKTSLNPKEKLFCVFSYLPKATVQAAIGTIPLTMGLACGELALTIAVVSILITAPVGAFLIDRFSHRLLTS